MKTNHIVLTIFAAAVIAAAFTAFAFQALGDNSQAQPVLNKPGELAIDSLESRLEQLEQQLIEERTARQALQKVLRQGSSSKEKLGINTTIDQETINNGDASTDNLEAEMANFRAERQALVLKRMQPEFKIQALIKAGFNKDEANFIVNSEADAQLEQLQAQYNSRRQALNAPSVQNNLSTYRGDQLRNKIGDDYYERYLKAIGMPTSVSIGSVMQNSPGANAGLLPGDSIIAYDNNRVFSVNGLNRMTAIGQEGESVLIEVKRNGELVQLTIPRGPIGVQSNQYGHRR